MSDTEQFFETIIPPNGLPDGLRAYIWTAPDLITRCFSTAEEAAKIVQDIGDTLYVYLGISLANGNLPEKQRVKNETAAGLLAIGADLDLRAPDKPRAFVNQRQAEDLLANLPVTPTLTVHSGHGPQPWWVFKEAWVFDGDDDRDRAAALLLAWHGLIKARAAKLGVDVDSVFDLARVLRVPGTVNVKFAEAPVPCRLLHVNGAGINPQDLEDLPHLGPHWGAATSTGASTSTSGADFTPVVSTGLPNDKLEALLANSDEFARTWQHERTDLHCTDLSRVDQSLCNYAARAGWTNGELAALIMAHREKYGGMNDSLKGRRSGHAVAKARRADYCGRTIATARRSKGAEAAREENGFLTDLLTRLAADPDPAHVWAAVHDLATLDKAAFGQAKTAIKAALGTAINLNDLTGAVSEVRREARRQRLLTADEGRPVIILGRQLLDVADDAMNALEAANRPPTLFARQQGLSRIVANPEDGRPVIGAVGEGEIINRLKRAARFVTINNHGEADADPPGIVARDILAEGQWPFPPLRAVVEMPTIRPDGTIINQPGYDAATRLFYAPEQGLTVPIVPDAPTPDELAAAIAFLMETIGDFPFQDAASLANALGLMLTAVARPAIDGPTPLALIDALQAGSGKGLLGELVSTVATGRDAPLITIGRRVEDESLQKKITSLLQTGSTFIAMDNLSGPLDSPILAAALTARTWQDRLLGRNDVVITVPVRCTWCATSNNVNLRGMDLPRRCYWIRIDPQLARPWERRRETFRQPDLLLWARANRGRLVAALLTMLRAWYAAGQPETDITPMGSFESWQKIVAGTLAHCRVPGFLENREALYEAADQTAQEWLAFYAAWLEYLGEGPATVREIVHAANEQQAFADTVPTDCLDKGGAINARRLGNALSARQETRHGSEGLRVVRAGISHSAICWRILRDHWNGE